MSTAQQLRRLLAILPHLANRAERSYEELAERVGAEWQTIRDDLYALSQRDDEPGGFVEEVQLFFGEHGVRAFSAQFHRPMRLSGGEAAALELGLSMLDADCGAAELAAIERARQRVHAVRTRAHEEPTLARRHVETSAGPLVLPDSISLERVARDDVAIHADSPATIRVRYSPGIAKRIAEQESGELRADGSLVVEHHVAGVRWAVRPVLQYGPGAEVLEPAGLREEIIARLRAIEARLAAG